MLPNGDCIVVNIEESLSARGQPAALSKRVQSMEEKESRPKATPSRSY